MDKLVRKKDLEDAISYFVPENKKAEQYANRILEYFGFESRIIDNNIDANTRKILYDMSDFGLFYKQKEMNKSYDGKNWTTYYWGLREKEIFKSAEKYREGFLKNPPKKEKDYSIYENLDEALWTRKSSPSVS